MRFCLVIFCCLSSGASALWHDPVAASALKASRAEAKRRAKHQRHPPLPAEGQELTVAKVVDGDTLRLANGDRVRLLGVNAPEMHNPDDPYDHRGAESRQCAIEILAGQKIRLRYGPRQRDDYGRILAFVVLPDGTTLNEELLRRGCARKMRIF